MKKVKKILLILLVVILLLGAATGIVLYNSNIKNITVTGSSFYTEDEVKDLVLGSKIDKNTIVCYLKNRFSEHKEIPFIEKYQINIKDMHSVEIMVYEKNIIGYIDYMDSYMYFDRDGTIVESSDEKLSGICKVVGIDFTSVVLGETVQTDNQSAFDEVLTMTQIFEKQNMKVKKITFDEQNHVSIKMKKVTIELGSSEYIDLKLAELNDIWPKIKKMSGTLYLDDYETGSNNTYVFVPSK